MNPALVTIIDYGMGNVGSVKNALEALGAKVVISASKEDISAASHLVLPGVGAFTDGMKKLRESGAIEPMTDAVLNDKKPLLGICLGMQMLADSGEEGTGAKGLGWIKGTVKRFEIDETKYRVPHIGWNDIKAQPSSILLSGVKRTIFYFVHSYHLAPEDESVIAGTTDYDGPFVSVVERGNIYGVQFHPEKSQEDGLSLLQNFLRVSNTTV